MLTLIILDIYYAQSTRHILVLKMASLVAAFLVLAASRYAGCHPQYQLGLASCWLAGV